MQRVVLYAIPAFVAFMMVEALWARRARREGQPIRGYEARDTAASLAMGLGNVAIGSVWKGVVFGLWSWLHAFRLFELPPTWATWACLVVAEDLAYYWFHRSHHEVRMLWAGHANHHSSAHFNFSTALRQSWTTPFTGVPFWLPLPLLGFPPWMILVQQSISLVCQFWLHTEAIPRLGALEWVLNTPSHHRVHHGRNPRSLDRNHGGIFIVWDRLFGTFEPETERADYGLVKPIATFHPLRVAFHEWAAMLSDARRASSFQRAVKTVLGRPGAAP
jgi:sterol desaturase/sphingolipid hydroxylase (fatty acid hydroxylase superfamily)